eukprot:gnl/Trimastix_PCT/1009.p1 GENE.gnl/Trimastix_PCT/1009~~gnl/Trimastix_PCT/1009.p1  ORF type:complete len:323 (+),score=60.19 gnl/Trimastix_PCT/1009:57-1025(+)
MGGGLTRAFPTVFNNRYRLPDRNQRLGSGSFGSVYAGEDAETGLPLAIKIEKSRRTSTLELEAKIYRTLKERDVPYVPRLIWYGEQNGYKALVLECMGPSLEDVLQLVNDYAPGQQTKFGLVTVLILGIRCVHIMRSIHEAGYVHRDIKPSNFVFDLDQTLNMLNLIDFGLAVPYLTDFETKEHVPMVTSKRPSLIGTPRFASVNGHLGVTLSRRDDMESLGYMLVYFSKGKLPWWESSQGDIHQQHEKIKRRKQTTLLQDLCEGLPEEFEAYFRHVKELKFMDQPDYTYLEGLFRRLLASMTRIEDPEQQLLIPCDWANIR